MRSRGDKHLAYLKRDLGSGFILASILLLAVSAFLLIPKWEQAAKHVADWAYLSLVVGVVIALVEFLREGQA